MNKYLAFIYIISIHLFHISCSDDSDVKVSANEPAVLSVKTDIATNLRSSGPISSFAANSELGLFLTHHGNIDHIYEEYGTVRNVRSIFNGWDWHQEPYVFLGPEPLSVFAYYPYNNTNGNPRQIPIEHMSQTDYMYGTLIEEQYEVSKYNPVAHLKMKHALSLVQFNIFKHNYPRDCRVNRIEVKNSYDSHPVLYSEGTMDISTGKITYTEGKNKPVKWENDGSVYIGNNPSDEEKDYVRLLVMPVVPLESYGLISVLFEIDGEILIWDVPANTEWKAGTKNTYTVFISGRELHIEDVIIEPWAPGIDELHPLD